ncbi:MAG: alpha/beta hydrolase [Promethearchaeota archaeon]
MPILNRSKIRPDVLKLADQLQKRQMRLIPKFLSQKENQGINFPSLWKKVQEGNERFFKAKNEEEVEELFNLLTDDEVLFLAKMLRFAFEESANIDQKENPISKDVQIEKIDIGGIPAEWQTVPDAIKENILLYFHGGGMIMGSPNSQRLLTVALGQALKMRILSVDYRLAPEYPFPAGLEDCVAAYKWLLSTGVKPENIIIAGDSAGGYYTLTTLIKLRDHGIKLPAGAFCLAPTTDFSTLDEEFLQNGETDPILADIGLFWWIPTYAGDADLNNPLISPALADLKNLPPILIQVSKIEMLYSHAKKFYERAKEAGVDITLQTWDDMVHVFQGFGLNILPEAKEAIEKIRQFSQKILN